MAASHTDYLIAFIARLKTSHHKRFEEPTIMVGFWKFLKMCLRKYFPTTSFLQLLKAPILLLRSVTMGIKNFLSHVKNHLLSLVYIPTHSSTTLNCRNTRCLCMTLNYNPLSGCMTLNCPPSVHNDKLQMDNTTHDAFSSIMNGASPDATMYGAYSSTNGTSTWNTPELDQVSSMDCFQTHDSLITPESPRTHSPSPCNSLEEGASITDVPDSADSTPRTDTQVGTTQVRTDSLTYDSLVTALSRLSLAPDPYQDHQWSLLDPIDGW